MKRILVALVCFACAATLTATAAEGKKKRELTEEQKTVRKEMMEKYDANKDGKLDKEERAKFAKEDKQKWAKAFKKKKPASTNTEN
ncbi:MAG TPA: hypothetical protein VEC99_15050 [Clostridia bacterium]|nr:hypothetical protein [Clostridia bacterium]